MEARNLTTVDAYMKRPAALDSDDPNVFWGRPRRREIDVASILYEFFQMIFEECLDVLIYVPLFDLVQ